MTRLLVIGNSHMGALKRSHDADPAQLGGVSLDYMGAPHDTALAFRLEDATLVPGADQTTVGIRAADLAAYDGFVLVGLAVRFTAFVRFYRKHRVAEHAVAEASVISHAVLGASVDAMLRETPAFHLARDIRSVSARPLLLIAEPFPAREIVDDARWRGSFDHADQLAFLRDLFQDRVQGVFAALNVRWVPQDPSTIVDDIFTDARFRAAAALRKGRTRIDFRHMNEDYGRIMLARLEEALEEVQRST